MENNRYKIESKKITLYVFITFLVFLGTFYFGFGSKKWPPETIDYVILVILFVSMVILDIFAIKSTYYTIVNNAIIQHRFGKINYYDYSRIIYIDKDYSLKHKALTMVMDDGKIIFLTFDKEGKIYEMALKNAKKLISKEELNKKFPKIKV